MTRQHPAVSILTRRVYAAHCMAKTSVNARSQRNKRTLRRVLLPLLLVFGSVSVCLVIAEIAVRVLIPQEQVFLAAHPVLGFAHPPGRTGYWMRERASPLVVTINSKGLRDREFDYRKPTGVKRVLMIGDSMTEAFQVELEQTSSKILEMLLNRYSDVPVQVLNFGVSGYGTSQQLLFYQMEGVKYDPDIVVVNFFIGNDLDENVYRKGAFQRPSYTLDGGELVFHPTTAQNRLLVLLRDQVLVHSALVKLIKPVLTDNHFLHALLGRWGLVTGPQGLGNQDLELNVEISKKLLAKFREETQKRGHEILVYIVPASYDMFPSYPRSLAGYESLVLARWQPKFDELIERNKFYRSQLISFLQDTSIPYVDGYELLRRRASKGELLYTSMLFSELPDGHFSPLGHQRSAEAIFEALKAARQD